MYTAQQSLVSLTAPALVSIATTMSLQVWSMRPAHTHTDDQNISPVDAAGGSTTGSAAKFRAPQAAQALLLNTAKLFLIQYPYLQPLRKPQPYFNVRNLRYTSMNLQINVQLRNQMVQGAYYYKYWLQTNNSNNVSLNN